MKSTIGFRLIALAGGILLLASLALNAWQWWTVVGPGGYRSEIYGLVGLVGTREADKHFLEGERRLYKMPDGESSSEHFTGEFDGPFEVWMAFYLHDLGRAHRYVTEERIGFYNRRMKFMHENPDRFSQANTDVQQIDDGNAEKPIGNERAP